MSYAEHPLVGILYVCFFAVYWECGR